MVRISGWIENALGMSPDLQGKLLITLLALMLVALIRYLILRLAFRKSEDVRLRYRLRKTATYIAFAIAVMAIGWIWFEGFYALSTYLGLVSAALTIALQTPIVNLAGWAFILWRRPFEVGDRIEIGSNRGDVIDQRIFMFTLIEIGNWVDADQSTGRIIHVPNGKVFSEPIANYSKGFQYIWDEIGVLVTFESDWMKAKRILLDIASRHAEHLSEAAEQRLREAAQKFMIFYAKLTPTVYTSVKDSGVMLTLRFLCEPRRRRGRQEAIWEDILKAFAECDDIDFAYPTQRFYNNLTEGKPGAGAKGAG